MLAKRQATERLLQSCGHALGIAASLGPAAVGGRLVFQRIAALPRVAAEPDSPAPAHRFAAMEVGDTRLQNPVKQRSPLLRRSIGVALRESQHRLLHDVEGVFPVARPELRDAQRTSLDAG